MTELCWAMFLCAALPFLLSCWNLFLFRCPRDLPSAPVAVSVLIPARNEEASIAACLSAVRFSKNVELDVVVLDDHSTDATADIVRACSEADGRIRLATSQPLPEGWCGKQYACFQLSELAKFDTLVFLDADVRLQPLGLAQLIAFQQHRNVPLVSAFPRQIAGTWMEKLVVPMIHVVLLGYLPMWGMRRSRMAGFGAGCGQLFLAKRDIYESTGGHAMIRGSMHDGLQLPRAYRRAGYGTDLCDGSQIAECRMYRSAGQVWNGFAKNAREGIAKPPLIFFFTAVFLLGQVLPSLMLPGVPFMTWERGALVLGAFWLSILPRWAIVGPHSPAWEVLLHPFGVLAFLGIQWYANVRYWIGRPVGWKGRKLGR